MLRYNWILITLTTLLFARQAYAQPSASTQDVMYYLENDNSTTLTIGFYPTETFAAPPAGGNVWNTAVITLRWPDTETITIGTVTNLAGFTFAASGAPFPFNGGDGYIYQLFQSTAIGVTLPLTQNTAAPIFQVAVSGASGPAVNFELVDATNPVLVAFFGQPSINHSIYNDQFAGFFTSPGGLPVEWLSFEAKPVTGNSVQLDWVTASEQNNDFFLIERSMEGDLFELVGKVNGVGNSEVNQSYSFMDKGITSPNLYYRLKQVDFDGQFEYSDVVEVNFADNGEVSQLDFEIFPNPAVEVLNISSQNQLEKNYELQIIDIKGQAVYQGIFTKDESTKVISVSELPEGVYYITLADPNARDFYGLGKFVKE